MNLLFLDQFADLGGGQLCLRDLLPAVIARGWSAHVVAPTEGPLLAAAREAGATTQSVDCGPYRSGRKTASDLFRFARDLVLQSRLIESCRADLVYVNGPRLLPAAAWAARGRVPLLFHCHSYLPRRYAVELAGRSLRRAGAHLVAACRFVAEPLRRFVAPDCFHLVYNGVAGPSRCVRNHRSNGCRRVGVVGRIAPEKGQATFLNAARILGRDLSGVRFVVCGEPLFSSPDAHRYHETLRTLADGLPVEFIGWRDDVYSVLAGLDLLVVPSTREEGTTRVILEAYSAGVPAVAFRCGGVSEVIADGVTGFLIDSFTAEALAARIRELLAGPPEELGRVAEAGRQAWCAQFTLERYRAQMLAVIEKVAVC